ncbi:GyrI-like domain-containing protein [Demequina flava]|uniref:GyrI-like domain-containing protein n=1 Tax=Demequina flava TaxID=1095025 RepID=UPI000780CED5|nr:GyrI-like domain-containing protein [Demequina flava]
MSAKIDFKKSLDAYAARKGQFRLLDVPEMQYLMVEGKGEPGTSSSYREALAALYPVAYTLKFMSKVDLGRDYVVPPLEGLWWADDMTVFTSRRDKSQWLWNLMIMTPDWIGPEMTASAVGTVRAKSAPVGLDRVRLETLDEGTCVQTLHVGPFDEEGPVLAQLHDEFIPSQGLALTGRHHEIYLSDIRKAAPEKWRTILRQPVRAASAR